MHKPLCQNNKCNTTLTGQFTAPLCALSTVTFDFEVEEKRKKKKQLDAHLGHSLLATEIKIIIQSFSVIPLSWQHHYFEIRA